MVCRRFRGPSPHRYGIGQLLDIGGATDGLVSRIAPVLMNRVPRGVVLLELVVVLALLGIVGAMISALLVRQQRFYRGASELLYARESVRDALEVLASDIRGISVADTARLLTDSAIEVFSSIGTSVVCQPSGTQIGLPPESAAGNTLTSLLTQPDTGDVVLFYHDQGVDGGNWESHRITAFAAHALAAACPLSSGFSRSEDIAAGLPGFQISLADRVSDGVLSGAPTRFVRRGRYSLYRASDGQWYLGYRRCNAVGPSSCGAVQPLSGPYRSYSANPAATGLLLEYFDASARRLGPEASPLALARVDVTARAESKQRLSIESRDFRPADSGTVSIAIRNRGP